MEKGILNGNMVTEHWTPTMRIRWFEFNARSIPIGDFGDSKFISEKKLQQLYISNLGKTEWIDIPIEMER